VWKTTDASADVDHERRTLFRRGRRQYLYAARPRLADRAYRDARRGVSRLLPRYLAVTRTMPVYLYMLRRDTGIRGSPELSTAFRDREQHLSDDSRAARSLSRANLCGDLAHHQSEDTRFIRVYPARRCNKAGFERATYATAFHDITTGNNDVHGWKQFLAAGLARPSTQRRQAMTRRAGWVRSTCST